jgi:iron complex transport system substrate-binding protein
LIILGREKEMTVVDSADRIVTVKKPIERIVVTILQTLELMRTVKLEPDRVVGVESRVQSPGYKIFLSEYQDKPTVGSVWRPDVEAILSLHPDVVFLHASSGMMGGLEAVHDVLESAGITVFRAHGGVWEGDPGEEAIKFGYIFDKQDEAEQFIDWYRAIMNSIKETVEEIPEEDKPKVYFESGKWKATDESRAQVGRAGGKNIFGDGGTIEVEAVMDRNPDIIDIRESSGGYDMDAGDTAKLQETRDELMSRPELQNVNAVEDKRVYVISGYITNWGQTSGCRGFIQNAYMVKWFHPELFDDLDLKAIHQEYLTRFQGLDIDLDEKGVFVYHPEEHPDGS